MNTITHLLHPHETILFEARISPFPVLRGLYLLLLYALLVTLCGLFFMQATGLTEEHFKGYYHFWSGYSQLTVFISQHYPALGIPAQLFQVLTLGPVAVGIVLACLTYSVYGVIIRSKTELAVTDLRVMAKVGWIARDIAELHHETVQDLFLSQSILGRIFDYGTISIRGYAGSVAKVPFVSEPVYFRSEALEIIEKLLAEKAEKKD